MKRKQKLAKRNEEMRIHQTNFRKITMKNWIKRKLSVIVLESYVCFGWECLEGFCAKFDGFIVCFLLENIVWLCWKLYVFCAENFMCFSWKFVCVCAGELCAFVAELCALWHNEL